MNLRKGLFLLFIVFASIYGHAQQDKFWLKGIVRDSVNLIPNAHVVNLNTEKGTFTGDYGQYRIVVSIGDTLTVSSIQYEPYKVVITDPIAYSKKLNVILKKSVIELDEVVVRNTDLIGILRSDRKKVPKDSIAMVGRDMSQVIVNIADQTTGFDEKTAEETNTVGNIDRATDPTKSFKGVGAAFGLGRGNRKARKIKKITSDKFASNIIYNQFGKEFFGEIKIPEKQIFNFIDYCKQFDIKTLYNKELLLQVAVIFEREAPNFLKTLK